MAAFLTSQNEKLKAESTEQKSKLQVMTNIESLLTASKEDADAIFKKKLSNKELSTIAATLNKKLRSSECEVSTLKNQLRELQKKAQKTKRAEPLKDMNLQAPSKRPRLAANESASQTSHNGRYGFFKVSESKSTPVVMKELTVNVKKMSTSSSELRKYLQRYHN